jgi:hypothetical protein
MLNSKPILLQIQLNNSMYYQKLDNYNLLEDKDHHFK